MAALALAFVAFWWIGTYYDRAFGRVVGDMLVPFFAWLATMYIVIGILDHLELVRALSRRGAR